MARLTPLLALYVAIVLAFSSEGVVGDEVRYLWYARNLLDGSYMPEGGFMLWNGPGYPLLLAPFLALGAPVLWVKLLNAVLLFGAVLFIRSAAAAYLGSRAATVAAALFGLYPPFWDSLPLAYTEIPSVFLACGWLRYFCRYVRGPGERILSADLAISAAFLGLLCLTKVFYGSVLVALGTGTALVALAYRSAPAARAAAALGLGFLVCVPYLAYTRERTGEPLFWSTWGTALYWMSTPHDEEYGDWHSHRAVAAKPGLRAHHWETFRRIGRLDEIPPERRDGHYPEELGSLTSLEADREFKAIAFENIRRRPYKYVRNWVANLGRLFFEYPYSYAAQVPGTLKTILSNAVLLAALCVSLLLGWRGRRAVPAELAAVLAFSALSVGGASLVSAYGRMLQPTVPALVLWIAWALRRFVRVDFSGGTRHSGA